MSAQRTVNFRAVQYMENYWTTRTGLARKLKPKQPTVNGIGVSPILLAAWHYNYPGESELERANRLDILDTWTFNTKLVITANKSLHYKGESAKKIAKAYNGYIYGK